MMRLVFSLLAAAMLGSVLALWWRPPAPPPGRASEPPNRALERAEATPEATAAAAAPARVGPVAPPAAAASPPAPAPEPAPVPAPAPEIATARLEEEPVEVVTTPPAFSEAPADSWVEASVNEEEAPEESPGEQIAPESPPVDVERSGDLIRRMLVLYDAMRD